VVDQGYYGGTRYMPAAIGLLTTVGAAIGDIAAGRALALAGFALALAVVAVVLRRAGLAWSLTAAGLLVVPAASEGWFAAFAIRFDVIAIALQLAALALFCDGRFDSRRVVLAGVLAGAAPCFKLTAVWGLVAVAGWLLVRRMPKSLARLTLGAAASWLVFFASFVLVPGSQVLNNLLETSTGEDALWRVDRSIGKLAAILAFGSTTTLLVLAGALGVLIWAAVSGRWTIWHGAWVLAAVQLLIVLPDRGIDGNHLLDLSLLSTLVIGLAVAPAARQWTDASRAAIAVTIVAYCSLGLNQLWRPVVTDAASQISGRAPTVPTDPLQGVVPREALILSEDPALPAVRDQRPVLGDPFLFRRLALEYPERATDLVERLEAHEFDAVVLLDTRPAAFYRDLHLGEEVYEAVLREYPVERPLPGYVLRLPLRSTE